MYILNICRTLSLRSKKEGEKDLKSCVSIMLVSCACISLHVYFTIRLMNGFALKVLRVMVLLTGEGCRISCVGEG